jgi:hypothetical protein
MPEASNGFSTTNRLRLVLLVMIGWDVLLTIAELSFGSPLFEVDGDEIGGFLGARGGFGGTALIPMAIYVFVLVRGPLRYRNLLWVGVIEHGATVLFAVYHVAVDDLGVEDAIVPFVVSAWILVLLLLHMPRGSVVTE